MKVPVSACKAFEGVVIGKRNRGLNSSFTVRKNLPRGRPWSATFQTHSPMIASISVKRRGDVRKAKLYYLRERRGPGGPYSREDLGASKGSAGWLSGQPARGQ